MKRIKIIFFIIYYTIYFMAVSADARVLLNGISPADTALIKKNFPTITSESPSLATLDEIIRHLTKTETYSTVRLMETGSDLTLFATPLKKISEIKVSGNEKFNNEEILVALGIKIGSKFDNTKVLDSSERLKEFYAQHGYFNTLVSLNFEELANNELRILIRIRERQPCLVEAIEFQVAKENIELQSQLTKKVRKNLKKNFTEDQITNIENTINEYLLDKKYLNTKAIQKEARYNSAKSKVKLIYEITDPYSYEIHLIGNRKVRTVAILDQIKFAELAKGGSDPAEEIAQKIRNHYINGGFAHAKVYFDEKVIQKTFTKRIMVNIEEGALVEIESLDVAGRISRRSVEYANFILKNSSEMIEDKVYVRSDLENGYKNLTISLNNQGYLKAKVQSARVEFNNKKDKVKITVILDEGPLTQLTKINFYGSHSFVNKQLMMATELENNTPLRLNALEKSIELLKKFYHDRGYIEMTLLNENSTLVQYDDKGLNAELHFRISEGPQVFVKAIHLDGNTFTKDYVVLREANIDVGDLVTPELLAESRRRLDNLRIFSRIDLRTMESNTNISQRTIIISVQEKNPGLFKFGAGITNERQLTARGFSSLSYNNIAGTARAVSLRGTVQRNLIQENYIEYEAGISYLEPFILNRRIRGRAGYTRSEQISGKDGDEKVLATDSIKFSLEKDLTSRIKFSWLLWGFDSVEKFDLPSSGPLVRESRQEIAYIGPSLDVDYRDNSFLPTTGTYTKIDGEYSSPELGSSDKIEFVRTQGLFTHYYPFTSKVVWANSMRAGYEKNLSGEVGSGVPESFAFFLGGYNSIRGYTGAANDRIPNDLEFPPGGNDTDQLIIPGESRFYLAKTELRFPLWMEPFGGVIFYDAGQVDIQGYNFKHPIRQSYGIGIRVNTPVGPISLDYARKTRVLYKNESPDQWHLSIGTF